MNSEFIMVAIVYGLLFFAAWTDFTSLKIPNPIPIIISAMFPLFSIVTGMTWEAAILEHFAAGLLILILGLLLFAIGKVGGGDVKLLAAVSIWLGWSKLGPGLLAIAVVGSLMCFALLAMRQSEIPRWLEVHGLRSIALEKGRGAPYAIAIAVGFALTQLASI